MSGRTFAQPQRTIGRTFTSLSTALMRRRSGGRDAPASVPPLVQELLRSPGQPLDAGTRAFMEPRFGHDFGRVRVHSDARAAESARAVNALAYTVGQDIVFGAGQYAAGTTPGRRLLAHELAHTLQQPAEAAPFRDISAPSDPAEQEAETLAAAALSSEGALRPGRKRGIGVLYRKSCWEELIGGLSLGTGGPSGTIFQGGAGGPSGTVPAGAAGTILWRIPVDLDARLIAPSTSVGTRFRVAITLAVEVPMTVQSRLHLPFTGVGVIPVNFITGVVPPNPGNELCIKGSASLSGPDAIQITGEIFRGSELTIPVVASGTGPGVSLATGTLRVSVPESLRATIGPFDLGTGTSFVNDVVPALQSAFGDILSRELKGAEGSVVLSARTSAGIQAPVPGAAADASSTVALDALGDVTLEASLKEGEDPGTRRLELRATGGSEVAAAGGLVTGTINISGSFAATVPDRLRLRDLNPDLLRGAMSAGEGGGTITGRLNVSGIPGRLSVDIHASGGVLKGTGTFLSPLAAGVGKFTYDFEHPVSADVGMLGLVSLATSVPAEEQRRLEREQSHIGPGELDLGSSVFGLGLTGIQLREDTSRVLSVGVGPQFATEPTGASTTGVYAGFTFKMEF